MSKRLLQEEVTLNVSHTDIHRAFEVSRKIAVKGDCTEYHEVIDYLRLLQARVVLVGLQWVFI